MSTPSILILTNRVPYPLSDGGALAMHSMIMGYKNAGWRVHLLAMNASRQHLPDATLKSIYKELDGFHSINVNTDVNPINILRNFLFSSLPNHAERFNSNEFGKALQDIINRVHPQYVQVESIYLSGYLPLIKQLTKATTILRLHNVEHQIWERLANKENLIKRIYLSDLARRIRKYEIDAWGQYDVLLPISRADEAFVKRYVPEANSVVVPFGIDSVKATVVEERFVGYHLAAMDWLPNAEAVEWFLKEVWPVVHTRVPEFEFHYAGRHMPAHLANTPPAGSFCTGEVTDVAGFVNDKKILIVPLRSGGGIRIKILEAMAKGKIVISTDVGIAGIEAQPCIHYLSANNAEEFAAAIQWCLNNKAQAAKIATNGRKLIAEEYNNAVITQRLQDALGILKGHL